MTREVWYQEPRLTYDPELTALSILYGLIYTWQAFLRGFLTNQNNASIPVLNKRQEFPNRMMASRRVLRKKVGRNKGTRLISFSRGKPCMWLCHNACWLGMSVVLVHDRVGLGRSTYDESDPWRKDPQPLRRRG